MRPSRVRSDRERQFNYLSQAEYEQELRQQVEQKKQLQQQEKILNQQEILNHYKNYNLGAAGAQNADLEQLVRSREQDIQNLQKQYTESFGNRSRDIQGGFGFQGDMNEFAKIYRTQANSSGGPGLERPVGLDFQRQVTDAAAKEEMFKNFRSGGQYQPQDMSINSHSQNVAQRNNENNNIINGIFENGSSLAITPGALASQVAESERERRIKLRELERMKRMGGIEGGSYGQVDIQAPQISQTIPAIFGGPPSENPGNQGVSKREQMWQQKKLQRVASQDGHSRPIIGQPTLNNQLPIYSHQQSGLNPQMPNLLDSSVLSQRQQQLPHSSEGQMRSSRAKLITDAIRLDQSLNQQQQQQLLKNAALPPMVQNQKPPQQSNPLFGGEDDLIKRRREAERQERQKEYNDYILKQKQQYTLGQPVIGPKSATPTARQENMVQQNNPLIPIPQMMNPLQHPQSAQAIQRPSHSSESNSVLQAAGGLNLLGIHQLKKEEEKARMQREYKEMLDQQKALKEGGMEPILSRKEISDQVFNDIMSKQNNFGVELPPNPNQNLNIVSNQIPPKSQDFFKPQDEEQRKKNEIEKKKQYALELQQQMAQQKSQSSESETRKRRGGSVQPHQVTQSQSEVPALPQSKVFDYQQQIAPVAQYHQQQQPYTIPTQQFNLQNYPPQSNVVQSQAYQYEPYQQPSAFNPYQVPQQFQPPVNSYTPSSFPVASVQPQLNEQQPVIQQQNNQSAIKSADNQNAQAARSKQEEYRRELELQIKQKEEEKQQKKNRDKLLDEKESQMPRVPGVPGFISEQPKLLINDRGAPMSQSPYNIGMQYPLQQEAPPQQLMAQVARPQKITSQVPEDDHERKSRQQQYQEELQKQMDERKRLKEEEKRKQQEEDEIIERKMKQQQEELMNKQRQELTKEGRPQKEERKRNVRRDLFEPSSDNPTAFNSVGQKPLQPQAPQISNQQNPPDFQREIPQQMFSQPLNINGPSGFSGFPVQSSVINNLPINNRNDDQLYGRRPEQPQYSQRQSLEFGVQQTPFQLPINHMQMPSMSNMVNFTHLQSSSNDAYQQSQPLQLSHLQTQNHVSGNGNMENDYQQMINMYQRAFQEIIEFKNSYMDEVMKMREKVIKEREEILEYEKIKHQQTLEIQNLKAVQERLGEMLNEYPSQQHHQQHDRGSVNPKMNPLVQHNLNNLLIKQQEDIMRLSQSGNAFKFAQMQQEQHNNQQQQQYQKPNPFISKQQYQGGSHLQDSPNMLEQSLSSETKFVVVPQNRLGQQQVQASVVNESNNQLMQTWKDDLCLLPQGQAQLNNEKAAASSTLAQLQALTQTLANTLQGSSQFIMDGNNTLTPSKTGPQLATTSKMVPQPTTQQPQIVVRPPTQLAGYIPETIQEMPSQQEEDDSKFEDKSGRSKLTSGAQQQKQMTRKTPGMRTMTDEDCGDFNSRESSKSRGEEDYYQKSKVPSGELIRMEDGALDSNPINIGQENSRSYYQEDASMTSNKNDMILQKGPSNQVNLMMTVDSNPLGNTLADNLAQIDMILKGTSTDPQHEHNINHDQKKNPSFTNAIPISLLNNEKTLNVPSSSNAPRSGSETKGGVFSPSSSSMHMMQKTQQKTGERFHSHAAASGSSFYNATMQLQKQQEQTQQEELQKQLMRIYGATTTIQQQDKEEQKTQINQQSFKQAQNETPAIIENTQLQQQQAPLQKQSSGQLRQMSAKSNAEKKSYQQSRIPSAKQVPQVNQQAQLQEQLRQQQEQQQLQQYQYELEQQMRQQQLQQQQQMYQYQQQMMMMSNPTSTNGIDDLLMQTNINIADSMNEETAQRQIEQYARAAQKMKEQQQQLAALQQQQEQQMQYLEEEEPEEVKMNEKPRPIQYGQENFGDSSKFQQSESQIDIWNDPDLVPPPVVNLDDVFEEEEEECQQEDGGNTLTYTKRQSSFPAQQSVPYNPKQQLYGFQNSQQQYQLPPRPDDYTLDKNELPHLHLASASGMTVDPHGAVTLSNGDTSMHAGTINQLQMFSPPSIEDQQQQHDEVAGYNNEEEDDRINLGTYNQDQFINELEQHKQSIYMNQVAQFQSASPAKRPVMSAKGSNTAQAQPFSLQVTNAPQQQPQPEINPEPQYKTATQQPPQLAIPALKGTQDEDDMPLQSDRSMSRKEKDIIEIAKLIQKATDTTNSLLGHTDHFKFRFKKDGEAAGPFIGAKKQQAPQQQANLVKATAKPLDTAKRAQTVVPTHQADDKDSQILSNFDRMIQMLQQEKNTGLGASMQYRSYTQHQEELQKANESVAKDDTSSFVDPIAAINQDSAHGNEIQLRKGQNIQKQVQQHSFTRPLSSAGEVQKQPPTPAQHQHSQHSLGKFAQMAISGTPVEEQKMIIDEVNKKFGSRSKSRPRENSGTREISPFRGGANNVNQAILRPVSGRSNLSNRYQENGSRNVGPHSAKGGSQTRSNERTHPEMYFDDDEDEEVHNIAE